MTNTNNTDASIITISNTMIEQLGGRFIFAMAFTGCTYGWDGADAVLTLKVAPALVRGTVNKATHVTIRLTASDTYTVTTMRVRARNVSELDRSDDVYADSLRPIVESMTGLRMSL